MHEGNLERAVTLLEEKTDFISQHRNYHDVSMVSKQVHLELHFSIKENMDNIDSLLSQVWNYAEPTGEGSKYKLTPEYQIFHVIAHMSYHMVHGGLGIRPFIDLWLLRNKTTYDEATVREYCENCGILKFYETSCELSDSWLSNKLYTETTRALEEYCLKGGVFGNVELAGAGNQREFRGISYLFKRLFVSNNVLKEMYPGLRKKPFLSPAYQVRRWFRLLNRDKRTHAIAEIRRTYNTKSETIDSFDKLLTSVGL